MSEQKKIIFPVLVGDNYKGIVLGQGFDWNNEQMVVLVLQLSCSCYASLQFTQGGQFIFSSLLSQSVVLLASYHGADMLTVIVCNRFFSRITGD